MPVINEASSINGEAKSGDVKTLSAYSNEMQSMKAMQS